MNKQQQIKLAEQFADMHHQNLFVLPNAWNGGSAKVFQKQGFKAIATTSAGIAYSMGLPDGEHVKFTDLLRVVKEIVNAVTIPVSVDIERGYATNLNQLVLNVSHIIEAGAVGINIEDGNMVKEPYLDPLNQQLQKIQALSKLKQQLNIPFVINARTCVFWLKIGSAEQQLKTAIKRANAFSEAGADCVFIPGALSENIVKELVENIKCPINLVASPLASDLAKLNELGVKRLSIGSAAVRAVYHNLINIGNLLKNNDLNTMFNHQFSYNEANNYFK